MPDDTRIPSLKKNTRGHVRTSSRGQGHRLSKAETLVTQEKFLKAFASNGNVRAACMVAGIDRSTVHSWAEHDERFSMQYNLAKEDVDDAIRAEIFRRGMFGEKRYETSQGKVVFGDDGKPLTYQQKSDVLLIFMAKSRMPEFRDKQQVDVSGDLTIKTQWGGGALEDEEAQIDRNSL